MSKYNIFFKTTFDADEHGHFGEFGGRYVPEMLMPALEELEKAYRVAREDPTFLEALMDLYHNYSGRPTPLYYAENLTKHLGGAKIYLKYEGLSHTGAHKINHCLGQALLAKRMGKKRLIAETGAGQHGLATATVAAKFGFECTVYMGEVDYERQRPNVFWMEQLGATVVPVTHGTKRLKDAVMAAIQDWIANVEETYFLLGSAVGPHPYPSMVRDFQSIVGLEVKEQLFIYNIERPDYIVACIGGGSNAMGIFNAFLDDERVKLVGVEAGGDGIEKPGRHASRLAFAQPTPPPSLPLFRGRKKNISPLKRGEKQEGGVENAPTVGVVEGFKSFFLQNSDGQIQPTHSISAGLDYAGIGPQHAYLYQKGRVQYVSATDQETLNAFQLVARKEGIFPALESAHAVACVIKLAPTLSRDKNIVVNISGRGDKDIFIVAEAFGDEGWKEYLRRKAGC